MSDKSYNQPQSSSDPLVSVIIATKNEEQHIENCLLSISEQTYPQIETIVVDNYSTDKTQEIALRHTDKVFEKGLNKNCYIKEKLTPILDLYVFKDCDEFGD